MKIVTYAKQCNWKQYNFHIDRKGVRHEQEYTRYGTVQQGFIKPDKPTVNPKALDGYRNPSAYSCPGFSTASGTVLGRASTTGEISGESGNEFVGWKETHSGTCQVVLARNAVFKPPVADVNALRSKLLNDVRGEVLDMAMVLAEMQGTADTITNGLMRIARSLDAFKKGNPRHYTYLLSGRTKDNRRPTDAFLRESSGLFLEWKYGIMPTVYDIAGACKGMDMNEDGSFWDNPPLLVARATEKMESTERVEAMTSTGGGASVYFDVDVEYYSERKARLDYSVTGEGLRGLNRYGIGLSTIPTVMFDKTPFSFVLNMAIPIAELIKAWTALTGCTVRGYSETTYCKARITGGGKGKHHGTKHITVNVREPSTYVDWYRTVYPTVPMPLPYVRNPIKTGNLATVLALFTQLRKPSQVVLDPPRKPHN